ncbi:MAG TPA: type II secretion system F family protein [Candidatus Omnitrophica bacterium]|nr:type II secretion system F family protein [Candidatus Omnitrophota bacterium]
MPKFEYVARTREGKRETGVVEVPSEDNLVSRLQDKGLIVTKVTPVDKGVAVKTSVRQRRRRKFGHSKIKLYDLVFFARQLAILLDSGITIHKSLDAILKQVDSAKLYKIVADTKADVETGLTLKDALAKYPKVFSDLWINLIESGEASGNLALVLDRLAQYLEMQADFRRRIISGLMYPAILFIVALGAIFFFVLKIVPTFTGLFSGFNIELPLITQILIGFSANVKKLFVPSLFIFGGIFFIFKQFIKTTHGRRIFDKFKLSLPVFGNFFKVLAVERFTSEMATLIEGGVPILYALEITERSVGNVVLEEVVKSIKINVREGKALADLMDESGFFEPMVVQMVSIGEEVGELSKMLRRVADFYATYLETFIDRFTTIFEPIMLVFMGGVVGVMLIALFLPIFKIASASSGGGL